MSDFIPFDQFQRSEFIRKAVGLLSQDQGLVILEVGGAHSPLRQLLSNHKLIVSDRDAAPNLDVRASGLTLPFRSGAFDLVLCTDVIEHIEKKDRHVFLKDLLRVSKMGVILGFPQDSPEARNADRILMEFIKLFQGSEYRFLSEHRDFGLPEADEIHEILKSLSKHVFSYENANIYSWLPMMIGNFALNGIPAMEEPLSLLNRFFNSGLEPASHRAPNYRRFLLALKKAPAPPLKKKLTEITESDKEKPVFDYAGACFVLAMSFRNGFLQSQKSLAEQVELLREKLEASTRANEQLQNSLVVQAEAKEDENLRLRDSIEKLGSQLESKDRETWNVQESLQRVQRQLEEKINQQMNENRELAAALESQRQSSEAEKSEWKHTLEKLQTQLTEKEKENRLAGESLAELELRSKAAGMESQELRNSISQMHVLLEEKGDEIERLRQTISQMGVQLEARESEMEKLQESIQVLVQNKDAELAKQAALIVQQLKQINSLEAELYRLEEKLTG